jgi:hypothetical protein
VSCVASRAHHRCPARFRRRRALASFRFPVGFPSLHRRRCVTSRAKVTDVCVYNISKIPSVAVDANPESRVLQLYMYCNILSFVLFHFASHLDMSRALTRALDDSDSDAPDVSIDRQALVDAEAKLVDAARRVTVARTQFAEYARARAEELRDIDSDALETAVRAAAEKFSAGDDMWTSFEDVREALRAAAEDAERAAAACEDELARDADATAATVSGTTKKRSADDADVRGAEPADDEMIDAEISIGLDDLDASDASSQGFVERAKYVPLRLTSDERKWLRLLEAALHVSEYTDKVDIVSYKSKTQRITKQLREICAILTGLVVATDYKTGQQLCVDRDFKDNEEFFQDVFEIGRRHKVMNPEKMRSEYGKMVYLLQDSQSPQVQELLEFRLVKPLKTVYSFLKARNGEGLLADANMELATGEIMHEGLPRHEVQRMIKKKERARDYIASKYQSATLSKEDILQCLYSIADNNAYLRFNRDPVDKMLGYLAQFFNPNAIEGGFSLAITMGLHGARLSHNHQKQYTYASQSMMLWREVSNDMFKLWYLAESDLLSETSRYDLTNTGQGLNRVQSAPRVGKAMHGILATCQRKLGHWVGSSVIHLGDHNVPNALMFIDKYTQVSRILNPVVLVIEQIPVLAKDPGLKAYIDAQFGGVENAQKTILKDFFSYAFDGSGAENFFDAGSCIDGRLTSAWNWCSKIEKKSYYPIFKLAGFSGFDGGDFRS